jgi:hypothetical protein
MRFQSYVCLELVLTQKYLTYERTSVRTTREECVFISLTSLRRVHTFGHVVCQIHVLGARRSRERNVRMS